MDNQAFLSYDCEAALVAGAGQGAEQALADNPYKSLIDRMKEDAVGRERGRRESDTGDRGGEDAADIAEHGADKEKGERKDLGPMPFSILPPHMLNMMERIREREPDKKEGAEEREEEDSCPMNLSSERDSDKRMSEARWGTVM